MLVPTAILLILKKPVKKETSGIEKQHTVNTNETDNN